MELAAKRRTKYTHAIRGETHHFDAEGLHVEITPKEGKILLERSWNVAGNEYVQSETINYGEKGIELSNRSKTINGRKRRPEEMPLDRYHFAALYMMAKELPEEHRDAVMLALSQYNPNKWKQIRRTVRDIERS